MKSLNLITLILLTIVLVGCNPTPQYQQPPVQYSQPAVQVAPAPVVVQAAPQNDNTGLALVGGAAMGALAMHALSNNREQAVVQQAQPTTVINRTTIIHQTNSSVAAVVVPVAPTPAPAATPNYAQGPNPVLAARQQYTLKTTPTPMLAKAAVPTPPPAPKVSLAKSPSVSYAVKSTTTSVSYRTKK